MTEQTETHLVPAWLMETLERIVDSPPNPHTVLVNSEDRAQIKTWFAQVRTAHPPVASLAARMKAAGMYSIEELLSGKLPTDRWVKNAGVTDIASFGEWLERKTREYLTMKAKYELKDLAEDDMIEWVLGHYGAFSEVLVNFKAACAAPPAPIAATPVTSRPVDTTLAGQMIVKTLVWRTYCAATGNCKSQTPFGDYIVELTDGNYRLWHPGKGPYDHAGDYKTPDAAKAAAQSDYERRVRACLVDGEAPNRDPAVLQARIARVLNGTILKRRNAVATKDIELDVIAGLAAAFNCTFSITATAFEDIPCTPATEAN